MNKLKLIISACTAFLMVAQLGVAGEVVGDKSKKSASKVLTNDFPKLLDANRIDYWISNNGRGATDPAAGTDLGLYFPAGSPKSIIFADGFLFSYNVTLANGTVELRSNGGSYNPGLQAGKITANGVDAGGGNYTAPVAAAPGLPKYRVYKVVKDWQNLPDGDAKAAIQKDYEEWPWQDGAPVQQKVGGGDSIDVNGFKVPQILGNQTMWYVANDMSTARANQLYGSKPTGIELQVTIFGFDVRPLNTMAFMKFKIINKSGLQISDMYVSNWSDPDLGGASDDLVGVDTLLKLGYVYNATNKDAIYNLGTVPAGGYVFFQGPLVDAAPTDSGITGGVWYHGKKNLPLSSFAYYINGGPVNMADPALGSPNGTIQLNRYQKGLDAIGNPLKKSDNVTPTKFPMSGDPVAGTGDLDGVLYPKGDRRMLLSSGPFNMAPGDQQEIVSAVIVGQGANNLGSVASIKKLAIEAQKVFNKNFKANGPPPAPVVKASGLDRQIVLDWSAPADFNRTEKDVQENYKFEGYKVYQLPTPQSTTVDEAKLIATYDLNNGITLIKDEFYDERIGEDIIKTAHLGNDGGLSRFIIIDNDAVNGGALVNNREYYFAVTAYNAYSTNTEGPNDIVGLGIPTQYENSLKNVITVTPRAANIGVRYSSNPNDKVTFSKVGGSDGQAFIKVVDPSQLTGDSYEIRFQDFSGTVKYNVYNTTKAQYVFADWRNQPAGEVAGAGEPTFDGLQAYATGPKNDFKDFKITKNANGVLNPPSYGAFAFNTSGFPNPGPYQTAGTAAVNGNSDRPSSNSQASGKQWGIHAYGAQIPYNDGSTTSFMARSTQYTGGLGRPNQGLRSVIPDDIEIRFTGAAETAKIYNSAANFTVPFQVWNTKGDNDPSNDFRILPGILDLGATTGNVADGIYSITKNDHPISGADNDPVTDPIYLIEPLDRTPGEQGFNDLIAKINANGAAWAAETGWAYYSGPDEYDQMNFGSKPSVMRLVFVGMNLASISDATAFATAVGATPYPETGTVFKIVTTKPNGVNDKFAFSAPAAPAFTKANATADLKNINVFPNPYYGASSIELSKYNRQVTFTHLPLTNTKIKIFTIAGTFVSEIKHENGTQYDTWNLTNFAGVPVASGMYVAYIETPYGTTTLKIGVVQEAQYLDNI